MGFGIVDKNDLAKWEDEDLVKAKGCTWMIDRPWKNYPDSFFKQVRECMWWYNKLCQNLPSRELYDMKQSIKRLSMFFNFKIFESKIRFARYDIVQKLLAHEYQKRKMIEEAAKRREHISKYGSTVDEYRFINLIAQYPEGSVLQEKQIHEKVTGYIPNQDVLTKIPPMEIIEYCGFRLIKYDMWHGYYAAILCYPKGNGSRKTEVFYDENSIKLEAEAENKFNEEIDKHINLKVNPYGDKSFTDIDISNVKNSMGYSNSSSPLDNGDIF